MLACVKTTDEPVFILSIKAIDSIHALAGVLSGVVAKVRRPTLDEKGAVTHKVEDFFVEELETREDNAMRKVEEINALQGKFAKGKSIPDAPVLAN